MKDAILSLFRRRNNVLNDNSVFVNGFCGITALPFADVIFMNIIELLTDITNDVELTHKDNNDIMLFAEFKDFFNNYAKRVLNKLFVDGYCVIGYKTGTGFSILTSNDYFVCSDKDKSIVKPIDSNCIVYVMRSNTYMDTNKSDKKLLHPFLEYLDNVLNASNTVSSRLGSLVVGSPVTPAGNPTASVLNKEERMQVETEISNNYGSLSKQKQFLIFNKSMDLQTINLSGLDQRTVEKSRIAILAICDRIKVPANQVAIIDANSSKSLSNGSELREGDFNKYQSFERLLNQTFIQFANNIGLKIDYTIYNKPMRTQA